MRVGFSFSMNTALEKERKIREEFQRRYLAARERESHRGIVCER